MNLIELERHITRFTFDGNSIDPDHPRYDHRLVLHVVRRRPDQWYISQGPMVRNHQTDNWDTDYEYRHSDKEPYVTDRDTAICLAQSMVDEMRVR